MDWLLVFSGLILILIGLAGCVLPVLPGAPIAFLGIVALHFSTPEHRLANWLMWLLFALTLIVTVLDYIIPAIGTKKFGGTKYGVWGSTIGLIAGLFLSPIGIIVMPFVGALIGELIAGQTLKQSTRSAWGSFVGFLAGTGIKLALVLAILAIYIKETIVFVAEKLG